MQLAMISRPPARLSGPAHDPPVHEELPQDRDGIPDRRVFQCPVAGAERPFIEDGLDEKLVSKSPLDGRCAVAGARCRLSLGGLAADSLMVIVICKVVLESRGRLKGPAALTARP